MKNYFVKIPLTGYVEVEVDAENKDEALNKAFAMATLEDVAEWELHRTICEGNIFHGILNEWDIWEEE